MLRYLRNRAGLRSVMSAFGTKRTSGDPLRRKAYPTFERCVAAVAGV